jgi:hypothetical protein
MVVTPFPSGKVVEACAAVSTWRNARPQQAMALEEQARDLILP